MILLFLSLNNALLDTDLSQVLDFEIAVKLTIFLFSSCADGAEKPSEGCKMTVTAGAGFAMSSLMAIIAAILLLICELPYSQMPILKIIQNWHLNVLLFCKSLKPFVNDLDTLNKLIS